jgi:hypothetical protein
MTTRPWDAEVARDEIVRLTAPDVLGFYTHVEATTVFAIPPGQIVPVNVFSILVAEERPFDAAVNPHYLNPKPIHLPSLKDWFFGVRRYLIPVDELGLVFERLCHSKEWRMSGELLQVGELVPIPPQFVPPDSTGTVPLNRVLKNNFWNGSYVLEWADPKKAPLNLFFDDPPKLQQLSEAIHPFIPLGIDGLSDRLGNIVVQLPTTVLITKFGQMRASNDFTVTIAWHPRATERQLRATCEKQHDHVVSEFMSATAGQPDTMLPMRGGQGLHRAMVWDDQNRVLLAASGDLAFISAVSFQMHAMSPGSSLSQRVFTMRDEKGIQREISVPLAGAPTTESIIGEPTLNPAGDWTGRRIYQEELARLAREKRFVQYKPLPRQQAAEHQKALVDLRILVNEHGKEGAWLWDPYLAADDILNTLFYCRYPNSDLRALTAGSSAPEDCSGPRKVHSCIERHRSWISNRLRATPAPQPGVTFADKQRAMLDGTKSNFLGLRLEFRVKSGQAGWAFHDRFLIFPATGRGALAWSLGTSVNSIGKQHHILQRVDDGQLIMQAFRELWDQLNQPEHLIWKKP